MKICVKSAALPAAVIFILGVFGVATEVLPQDKTIILVRHAEKVDSTSADPELSEAGRDRAIALVRKIKKYRPGAIFSTDLKRTRDTARPIAAKRGKEIRIYDARQPGDLIDLIMASRTKRFVIVGHSNTIPVLANLIAKKELFRNLEDAEYGTIWVIRIKKGAVKKIEILSY
ncbi:MAG TPA: histidine phosphatase family protein [Blastocatellia bacterium]|nr:histidine phosphatase family protein [Blastocatellia bacterium]